MSFYCVSPSNLHTHLTGVTLKAPQKLLSFKTYIINSDVLIESMLFVWTTVYEVSENDMVKQKRAKI